MEKMNIVNTLTLEQKWIGVCTLFILCVILLIVGAMKRRMDWFIRMLFRTVMGVLVIYGVNYVAGNTYEFLCLGYNPATILTSGILGIPGLVAMYGIKLLAVL